MKDVRIYIVLLSLRLPLEGTSCCIKQPASFWLQWASLVQAAASYSESFSCSHVSICMHSESWTMQVLGFCSCHLHQRPSATGSRGLFTFDGQLLHSTPLSSAAVGWQAEAADAAACSDAGAQDVVGVEIVTTLKEEEEDRG